MQDKFEAATAEKQEVEEMAEACLEKLGLAERLVGGLASENERWGREIEEMKVSTNCLIGDCMVAAGFVSYVGAFDQKNREALWKTTWLEDLKQNGVPMSETVDPLPILVTSSQCARMYGEGLPEDRISRKMAPSLLLWRWLSLLIPKCRASSGSSRSRRRTAVPCLLTQKNWIRAMRGGISDGMCVIIENLGEDIDATLDPVLSRAIYKKGSSLYIKFGGEEMNYDPAFSLYMQTRLDNPHYKPEIAAQCTLINFIATERGLEDQLLTKTVGEERPDLEAETRVNAGDPIQDPIVGLGGPTPRAPGQCPG